MLGEIRVEILIATHQCKHSYLEYLIMSVRKHLHMCASFLPQSRETLAQKKSSANIKVLLQEGLEKTDKLLAALDISRGSTDSLFPDETTVQWTVSACCELWVWYLIALAKSLFHTHHCHTINRGIHVQRTGVYVHINLISQGLWTLWHARGIRPQAVFVLRRHMNHTQKPCTLLYFIVFRR